MKFDDVVIGAGVSGLSAAILLAQNGREVAVLERAPVTAPTIRGFVRNGIHFDTGFHYAAMLKKGETFWRLCERLGIISRLQIHTRSSGAGDMFIHAPSAFRFHFRDSLDHLTEQLAECFPADSDNIRDYLFQIRMFLERMNRQLFSGMADPGGLFEGGQQSLSDFLKAAFQSSALS